MSKGSVDQKIIDKFNKSFISDPKNIALSNAINTENILKACTSREQMTKMDFLFSHEVKPTCYITDQYNSGRCWSFAGLNILRNEMRQKYKIDDFEFSQSYIAFWDKFEKCNFFYYRVIETSKLPETDRYVEEMFKNPIQDGGNFFMLKNLVNKYGVIPKEMYPESYSSASTKNLNLLIAEMLRNNGMELRKIKSKKQAFEIKNKLMGDIYYLLCVTMGVPPMVNEKFEWKIRVNPYVNYSCPCPSPRKIAEPVCMKEDEDEDYEMKESGRLVKVSSRNFKKELNDLFYRIKIHMAGCSLTSKGRDRDLVDQVKKFAKQVEDSYYMCYPDERMSDLAGDVKKSLIDSYDTREERGLKVGAILNSEQKDVDEDDTDFSEDEEKPVEQKETRYQTNQQMIEDNFVVQKPRPSYTDSYYPPSSPSVPRKYMNPEEPSGSDDNSIFNFREDELIKFSTSKETIGGGSFNLMSSGVKKFAKNEITFKGGAGADDALTFKFTPKEFYNKVVPSNFDDFVIIINDQRKEHPYNKLYKTENIGNVVEGFDGIYLNLTIQEIKEYCIKSILMNKPVWFACDMEKGYHPGLSILDTNIFDTSILTQTNLFDNMNKAERMKHGSGFPTHAMIITGVDVENMDNEDKLKNCSICSSKENKPKVCNHDLIKINKWKVANSWGTQNAKGGHVLMTESYFDKHVYMIVIDKSLLTKKHAGIVEKQEYHKVLSVWDPIATSCLN
jgi:aminopeptidase C